LNKEEENKSTKEKWTELRGSAKMTFSVMAIIILSYRRKSMLKFRGTSRNVSSIRCIIKILAETHEHFRVLCSLKT
jgi:hypothetical protein